MSKLAVATAWHKFIVKALLKRGLCVLCASICLFAGMSVTGAQGQSTGTAPNLIGIRGPLAFERQTSPGEQYLVRDKDLAVVLTKSETLLSSPHLDARPIHLQFAGRSANA